MGRERIKMVDERGEREGRRKEERNQQRGKEGRGCRKDRETYKKHSDAVYTIYSISTEIRTPHIS